MFRDSKPSMIKSKRHEMVEAGGVEPPSEKVWPEKNYILIRFEFGFGESPKNRQEKAFH